VKRWQKKEKDLVFKSIENKNSWRPGVTRKYQEPTALERQIGGVCRQRQRRQDEKTDSPSGKRGGGGQKLSSSSTQHERSVKILHCKFCYRGGALDSDVWLV